MKKLEPGYLSGKLLLAMPNIGDTRFERAVIFICAHDEHGAMGLVVNAPAQDLQLSDLLAQLGIESDIKLNPGDSQLAVMNGGPVEMSRGFLLHSHEFKHKDTISIDDHYSITGTTDALKDIAQGNGPKHALFILGYAAWTEGQLESEIQDNAWLVSAPDRAMIFHDDPQEKWTMAISKMGFNPAMLSGDMGRA